MANLAPMAQSRLGTSTRQIFSKVWQTLLREKGIRDDALAGFDLGEQLQVTSDGVITALRLRITANPSNTETFVIGGHTFVFLTSLTTQDTTTQIKIGGDAATSRARAIKAVNGTADTDNILEGTTSFTSAMATAGTPLIADEVDTDFVRVRRTEVHGSSGAIIPYATASIAVSETLAGSGNIWQATNMNASGPKAAGKRIVQGQITITAGMITAAKFFVELPWTPGSVEWGGYASTGVKRAVDEAVTIDGNAVKLVLAGGGSPNWQANDTFRFTAVEA